MWWFRGNNAGARLRQIPIITGIRIGIRGFDDAGRRGGPASRRTITLYALRAMDNGVTVAAATASFHQKLRVTVLLYR